MFDHFKSMSSMCYVVLALPHFLDTKVFTNNLDVFGHWVSNAILDVAPSYYNWIRWDWVGWVK